MPQYCSTGGRPGLEGWTRQTSKLSCPAGQSQERPRRAKQAGSPPSVPALSQGGLRSWEELRASGRLGLVEELAMGYGPCLERGTTHLRMLFSLGVLPITTPFPPTFQKAELPQPLLARILLSGGLGSHHPAASMWLKRVIIHHWRASAPPPRPDLGCVWDTHRCTHAPSHIHTFAHSQGPR